ncbi:isoprenylcysteine carboxylmethyltransferase family protein [Halomonas sp. KM-1]|uniref:methyltransferase family protein n=1 Tax=Halomonas sp. KM-1 TaxID=590061 RepID=UPI000288935A|nr:isoprenylcysteine carboxylmethyltransferase family protein [Halomonas sp. KM-1]
MRWLILPPSALLFTAVIMVLLDLYAPLVRLWETPYRWGGIAVLLVGLGIAQWHAHLFRRLETNIDTFGEPGSLTRQGLFAVTRNPMYLGFVIALTGLAICLGSAAPFLAALCFALLVNFWYIPVEERNMQHKFGQAYLDYKAAVRRWL